MARKGLGERSERHDPAYLRAKRENFASRAIYKLEEIDRKFRVVKRGQRILDLGCWPGSWLQYAAERAGADATIVGVDLDEVALVLPEQVTTFVGDVHKLKPAAFVRRFGAFDLVLSDMAPNTTGNPDADIFASEELLLRALAIADACLRPGGHFVGKVFQGERFPALIQSVRARYQTAKAFRPATTRKTSREQYLVGRGHRSPRAEGTDARTAPPGSPDDARLTDDDDE